ncbi:divergent polysaccharide deacetylase family protein [Carboxydothermus pertinax]|uniref:N-acetylmuramoyl-L-alanine amidase n=1 Tax=Carboxydothermus pertinax TaxID=870242 RepID=A0A1L8CXH3_9THEO|nr:divergent polysaccharide deacetylase family protein [Carboxydothermus pertinax]GAV23635.1 N-acetylmuramoyl-L-alanine amidase [Carboxydothermus pertinax]
MKKLLFFIFFILIVNNTSLGAYGNLQPPLIVIDPGHGGIDPGTIHSNLLEKEINLKASLYLKQFLEKSGALVILTRDNDTDLAKLYPGPGARHFKDVFNRKKYIENLNPDLFISIHVNAGEFKKKNFGQVFYGRNPKSLAPAEFIQNKLNEIYKVSKAPQIADFLILTASTPGVLVEIGFIDDQRLCDNDFLKNLCQQLASSILNSLNNKGPTSRVKFEPKLLIIIDDFGNNSDNWHEFLKLDLPFTAAVMPFLNNTQKEAKILAQAGKDIIIHLPMEPKKYKRSWLGPKPVMVNLSEKEITTLLTEALKENTRAIGMNNHTGSKACENKKVVQTILSFCQKNNLIFIDSQTTPNSLFPLLGSEYGVVVLKRDIFLEINGKDEKKILQQIFQLQKIAKEKGLGIAIGHVGFEGGIPTVKALKAALPPLQAQGAKFCTLRDIVKKHP